MIAGQGSGGGSARATVTPAIPAALAAAVAAICTLAAVAALAAGARAATPIEVGQGAGVAIAVDGSGTAHIVARHGPPSAPHETFYCRVPAGTTAQGCPAPLTFSPRDPDNSLFDRALVAVSGGTVAVLWRECCSPDEVNARISTDSGTSFGGVRTLATGGPGADNPVAPGGDAITDGTIIGWTSGTASSSHGFQAAGLLSGPPATQRANLFGLVSFGAVSAFYGSPPKPLVVEETGDSLLRFRRHVSGSVNEASGWTPAKAIATSGDGFKRPSLGYDSSDVFLAYTDQAGGGQDRPLVRRYLAASDQFGEPTLVADDSATNVDIAVGADGRLHVVWNNSRGIWWAISSDRGASFTPPIPLADEDAATGLEVATGGEAGFAAFRTLDGRIWVVPLEAANRFRFRSAKKNKRKGTAKLTVEVPGPGEVTLRKSRKVKGSSKRVEAAGRVKLAVRPKRKLKRKLARAGKAKLRLKVTFTPAGGEPLTKMKRLRLVRR